MSVGASNRLVTNNLEFYYNMLDTKKSYLGPVHTNLASNPTDLSNATWSPFQVSVSEDTNIRIPDINVATTDYRVWNIYESTTTSGNHHITHATTVASGQVYTLSIYAKAKERSQIYITMFGEGYAAFDLTSGTILQTGGNTCTIAHTGNGWYRCTATITKTNSTSGSFFGIWNNAAVYSGNAGYGVYMCKPQIELNSFATPWGLSRTSGNSLRSLVAIPTIVQVYPNSVTYNNDNTFSYNGTSNYSSSESSVFPASSQPGSVCAWVKVEDLSVKQTVFSYGQVAGTSAGRTLYVGPGNSITYSGGTGAGALELVVTPSLSTGVWYNIVGVFDGTTVFIYLNGELLGSSALALFTGFFSLVYYGRDLSAQNNYLKGQIASILSYDRALMPFEILQNFNATRKSFNV